MNGGQYVLEVVHREWSNTQINLKYRRIEKRKKGKQHHPDTKSEVSSLSAIYIYEIK